MVMNYEELPENCPPLVKDAYPTVLWCYPSTTFFCLCGRQPLSILAAGFLTSMVKFVTSLKDMKAG